MATRAELFRVRECCASFLKSDDGPALQDLFERCRDYFDLEFGLPPDPAETQSTFIGLPEGKGYEDKLLIGIFCGARDLVGVLDVIRNYPQEGVWTIGLLLVDPSRRRHGMGTGACRAFERWAVDQGLQCLRVAVSEFNVAAQRFWQRLGFQAIEVHSRRKLGVKESSVTVMRRLVPRDDMP